MTGRLILPIRRAWRVREHHLQMYFPNFHRCLLHATPSCRHQDYTTDWTDVATALKDSKPSLHDFSLQLHVETDTHTHTHTHTHAHTRTHLSMQVLFFDLFQRKELGSFKVNAYCSEKQRSWMFHWYISDVIFYEWSVSMQLDCENYLPTGIQRRKKTILSGCFLHEKRIVMLHCQFQNCSFWKSHAHNHSNGNAISHVLFLHHETWPEINFWLHLHFWLIFSMQKMYNHDI